MSRARPVWALALLACIGCRPAASRRRPSVPAPAGDPAAFDGTRAGDERTVAGVKLCWCPPGKFTMGSPPGEPERRPGEDQVEVTLTRGFWIGQVRGRRRAQWKRVVGKLPGELTAELPEGDDYPVGNVNFAEAEAFCRKLTELARKSGELPEGWEFRLPTEAQWEYACRAGTTTATAFGDTLSSKQANFKGKPYNGAEAGPSLGQGGQGRQLPGQRLGPARHARQHLRVVPGLVPRQAARRRRSGPVRRAGHGARNRTGTSRGCAGAARGPTTAGPAGRPSGCGSSRSGDTTTSASGSWPSGRSGHPGFWSVCGRSHGL